MNELHANDRGFNEFISDIILNSELAEEYKNRFLYNYITLDAEELIRNKFKNSIIEIDSVISFFELREDYEKCNELLIIKNKITKI